MKKALVVGLNEYPGCPLDWCDNDAIAIQELIEANGDGSPNFDVKLITDTCTKTDLRTAVKQLFEGDADIGKGVVLHALGKVDRIQHLDLILRPLQELAALHQQSPFRVGHNIAGMELHQVGFHKKPRLAASAAADYQHVFISRVFWIFGAVGHHQPFRLGQDHVVVKDRIDVGLYICRLAPPGAAVLNALAVFLRVPAFDIDDQSYQGSTGNPDQ